MEWRDLTTSGRPAKLNLGGRNCKHGRAKFDGWVAVDRRGGRGWSIGHVFPKPIPLASEMVDAILTEHFLEHITVHDAALVLAEACRVLKVGSQIRIAVPDINHPRNEVDRVLGRDRARGHVSIWTMESMREALTVAGFKDVRPLSYWVHSGSRDGEGAGYQHVHREIDWSHGWVRRTKDNDVRNREGKVWGELWATSLIVDASK